jgi:hypothetical protein
MSPSAEGHVNPQPIHWEAAGTHREASVDFAKRAEAAARENDREVFSLAEDLSELMRRVHVVTVPTEQAAATRSSLAADRAGTAEHGGAS